MRRLHSYSVALAVLILHACATARTAPDLPAGPIASDAGGAVGYRHGWERSRFRPGDADAKPRPRVENGFSKVVSPDGVFAVHLRNGLAVAVSGHGTDKDAAGSRDPGAVDRNLMDPDVHNREVLAYLLAAGIPRDQVGGVHASTYLSARGAASDPRPAPPQIDGYATILQRTVEGHAVVDSVAWARMDARGRVMSEWVYWPALPARVLAEARRLDELLQGPDRARFLERLPAGSPPGKVVIRHSSATVEGEFEAFASYDVLERRTPELAEGDARSPRTASVVVRHFDVDGRERRLPQERRSAGPDTPGKEARRP